MSTVPYFILMDSSGSGGRVRIIQGGYEPTLEKSQTVTRTIAGGLDVAMGAVYETHRYMIRIRYAEEDSNYIVLNELKRLYKLNNPNGTPSNLLTLVDNYGVSHQVYFTGNLALTPVSVFIDDVEAWFTIPIEFTFLT